MIRGQGVFLPFTGVTVAVSVMEASLATSTLTTVTVLVIFVALEVFLLAHRGLLWRGTSA